MSKLNLNNVNIYAAIWKLGITILLIANIVITIMSNNNVMTAVTVVNSNVDNVFRKLDSFNQVEPEIPDENNENFQASCITPYNIIEHPDEVIAFMEAFDPILNDDPRKLELLKVLLLADRDAVRTYLESQYSNGYPRN